MVASIQAQPEMIVAVGAGVEMLPRPQTILNENKGITLVKQRTQNARGGYYIRKAL